MAVTVGSNIQALGVLRRLAQSSDGLSRTFERLASGRRINRASDDAASLAISDELNLRRRVFAQGLRNLNDGLSLLNIGDSALGQFTGILHRIKELSPQAANGIYGSKQRESLDSEAQALRREFNRILEASEFNGRRIFDTSHGDIRLQDGFGILGGLSIRLGSATGSGSSELEALLDEIGRVSVSSSGVQGNNFTGSTAPSVSNDGRYVSFVSSANNLVAGDGNGVDDVFVHDRQTGVTTRVSVDSVGTEANGASIFFSAISGNGRYVTFASDATNLVAGDTNGTTDIFVHDLQTGQTTRVSVDSLGAEGNGLSGNSPGISADGRYVTFNSNATNLVAGDTNVTTDVFVHDRQTGQTTRVSVDSSGTQANNASNSTATSISADGRYVTFRSAATNLVGSDTNGDVDIFVHDRQTGQTTRVSVNSSGTQGNGDALEGSISADGRFVTFQSLGTNFVAGDTNGQDDIFVHDRQTGQTTRVSVSSTGTQGNGQSLNATISGDGRYVAYRSFASNLVSGDTNGVDVFVHDRQTGQTVRVNVDNAGAQSNAASYAPNISADGKYVVFASDATNLVAGDTNARTDAFLAPNSLWEDSSSSSPTIASNLYLNTFDLTTRQTALDAMSFIDSHAERVANERAVLGAFQSRIRAAVEKQAAQITELASAQSRIMDADIADESSRLVRLNIIQQVAASVLAQANQQPALVLQLLRA